MVHMKPSAMRCRVCKTGAVIIRWKGIPQRNVLSYQFTATCKCLNFPPATLDADLLKQIASPKESN